MLTSANKESQYIKRRLLYFSVKETLSPASKLQSDGKI